MNARVMTACLGVRPHLESFADGELRGDLLRRVSRHVESCHECATVIDAVQSLGETLRGGATVGADLADLAGLADGVVSRIRAEEHESWRGKLDRATDDLHWVLVGAGSLTAAFLSVLLVSVVMQSSVEQRGDSLAAVLNTTIAPPQIGRATVVSGNMAPDSIVSASGEDDVEFANLAEINQAGHVMSLQRLPMGGEMSVSEEQPIANQMRSMRFAPAERTTLDPDSRQIVWLHTATEVRGTEMGLKERRMVWFYTTPAKKVL